MADKAAWLRSQWASACMCVEVASTDVEKHSAYERGPGSQN